MISEDRQKHIFKVAEFLKNYALNSGKSNLEAEELYVLGLLHDIGYEFAEEKDYKNHNIIGGEILKNLGYKHYKEVYYHGVINSPYQSEYLNLLNFADMHIDSEGNYVSFDRRLQEISERYGIPVEKLDSTPLVKELREKGFK